MSATASISAEAAAGDAAKTAGLIGLSRGRRWTLLALLGLVALVPAISFRSREIGAAGLDWQNGIKLALWLMLLGLGAATVRSHAFLLKDRTLLGFLSFGLFGLVSSLYSPVPAYSAACALGVLGYLLFSSFVVAKVSERDVLLTLAYGLAAYLAATLAFAAAAPDRAFLAPHEDEGYRLLGLSSHPNMLAVEVACFLCVLVATTARGYLAWKPAWALGLLGAVAMLGTGSRTSALAVAISIGAVVARSRGWLPMLAAIGTAGAAALALALGLGLLPPIQDLLTSVSRSGDASEVLTLTGRTDLWSFVLGKIAERPLFGYGFNSAETVLSRDWYGNADAGYSAHNVLLQSLLTVGIVGTLPFALVYALLIHRWLTEQQQTLASYLTPYLMILGITEIHIASMPVLLSLVVFLAMASEACRRHRGPEVPSLVRAPPDPDAARAVPRAEPP